MAVVRRPAVCGTPALGGGFMRLHGFCVRSAEQTLSGDETMPRLEGYRFGRLVVNGEEQTRDVIVLLERVVTNWRLADTDSSWRTANYVREGLPEHLVIGTGSYGRMHPDPAGEHRLPTAAALRLGWQPVW